MRISGFEILVARMPLKEPVGPTRANGEGPRILLVAAHDDEGRTGWGEAGTQPGATGDSIEGVRDELRRVILPAFLGRHFDSPETTARELLGFLDGLSRNQHAAFCAAELALLDLAGHAFGISVGDLLGPVRRERVDYGAVIDTLDPEVIEYHARRLARLGIRQLKATVGPDLEDNLRLLGIVREIVGPTVELRIDARCAWDLAETVRQLEAMSEFRLAAVEQPLPASDLQGLRELTATEILPVVADECLWGLEDARRLVDRRACDAFDIRISKVGGLLNAGRIHRCARAAGLECQLGAQTVETGLLSAAGRHYATRAADVRWLEGSSDGLFMERLITAPDITIGRGGRARALTGPGLGVAPVAPSLDACTLQRFPVG
jgi:L-alanine-DL-glutamate epimerase-like enolase superfamily enzyme